LVVAFGMVIFPLGWVVVGQDSNGVGQDSDPVMVWSMTGLEFCLTGDERMPT
jgi:hypothetical protein